MVIELTVRKSTSVTCGISARGAAVELEEATSVQRHRALGGGGVRYGYPE
jgi:hypothetical protein